MLNRQLECNVASPANVFVLFHIHAQASLHIRWAVECVCFPVRCKISYPHGKKFFLISRPVWEGHGICLSLCLPMYDIALLTPALWPTIPVTWKTSQAQLLSHLTSAGFLKPLWEGLHSRETCGWLVSLCTSFAFPSVRSIWDQKGRRLLLLSTVSLTAGSSCCSGCKCKVVGSFVES